MCLQNGEDILQDGPASEAVNSFTYVETFNAQFKNWIKIISGIRWSLQTIWLCFNLLHM